MGDTEDLYEEDTASETDFLLQRQGENHERVGWQVWHRCPLCGVQDVVDWRANWFPIVRFMIYSWGMMAYGYYICALIRKKKEEGIL